MVNETRKIPPVFIGTTKLPCKRHRNAKLVVEACPDCNKDVRIERHTDHARKMHVDVPVYRKEWKKSSKY